MKKQVEPKKKEEKKKIPEGLNQTFKTSTGKTLKLIQVLSRDDVWETKGRVVRTIVTHDGVRKLADKAGVSKDVEYKLMISPTVMNNMTVSFEAKICRGKECVTEIGEASNSNLGTKGRNNRVNMAQKRAYDRAVLRLIGVTGLLSEEEVSDEEDNEQNMHDLTPEENKQIAPLINNLLLAKDKKDLIVFSNSMKEKKEGLSEKQLDYVRKLYGKRVAELQKQTF